MPKPIGILGGSFDPVHKGHLSLANSVYRYFDLSEVRLIPLYQPVHRASLQASAEQRLQMLQLAVSDYSGLRVDDREIVRAGPSYTVDTLASLQEEFAEQGLCLIMGMDAFVSLDSWYQWQSIFEYAHIVYSKRPGSTLKIQNAELKQLYKQRFCEDAQVMQQSLAGNIFEVPAPQLDISSTQLREMIKKQENTAEVLPEKVQKFISKEEIYNRH